MNSVSVQIDIAMMENMVVSQKIKNGTTVVLLLGTYPKEMKSVCQGNIHTSLYIATPFTIVITGNLSVHLMDK